MKTFLLTPFGLGDFAFYLLRPVVYLMDWVWGTDLKDCSVCKSRRMKLNAVLSAPRFVALGIALVALIWLLL